MPSSPALMDHASSMSELARDQVKQVRHHVHAAADKKDHKKDPAVCPTDDEALTPRTQSTRSWDYVWRSGVAGGMAGCAVSLSPPSFM